MSRRRSVPDADFGVETDTELYAIKKMASEMPQLC